MEEIKLTLEQQFNIVSFEARIKSLSLEKLQKFSVDFYRQTIVKEKMFQDLLKKDWGF